jgi:hypothetical protein
MRVAIEEDQVTQSCVQRSLEELASRGLISGFRSDDEPSDYGQWTFSRHGWLRAAMRQLDAIEDLPRGWDSHGGEPPDPAIVDAARTLIRSLRTGGDFPKPHINPTPSGGVQFEWENDSAYLEVEVDAEDHAKFFFQDGRRRHEYEGEVFCGGSLDEIVGLLKNMYAG